MNPNCKLFVWGVALALCLCSCSITSEPSDNKQPETCTRSITLSNLCVEDFDAYGEAHNIILDYVDNYCTQLITDNSETGINAVDLLSTALISSTQAFSGTRLQCISFDSNMNIINSSIPISTFYSEQQISDICYECGNMKRDDLEEYLNELQSAAYIGEVDRQIFDIIMDIVFTPITEGTTISDSDIPQKIEYACEIFNNQSRSKAFMSYEGCILGPVLNISKHSVEWWQDKETKDESIIPIFKLLSKALCDVLGATIGATEEAVSQLRKGKFNGEEIWEKALEAGEAASSNEVVTLRFYF